MHNVEICLVIGSLGINKLNKITHYFVSTSDNQLILPSLLLDNNKTLQQTIAECFENITSIKYDWVEFRLLDIEKKIDNIKIYYLCTIPIETSLNNAFFSESDTYIFEPILQKAIRYV